MECVQLRVQDLDFGYRQITVHNGKGAKDRFVPLPEALMPSLQERCGVGALLHGDLAAGFGEVSMPRPWCGSTPGRPSKCGGGMSSRRRTARRSDHGDQASPYRPVRGPEGDALRRAACGYPQAGDAPYPAPLLRDPALEAGYDIRTVQELMGHKDVATTRSNPCPATGRPGRARPGGCAVGREAWA